MEKKHIDVFERIVQTAEAIKEAQEKKAKGSFESKYKNLEVDIQ